MALVHEVGLSEYGRTLLTHHDRYIIQICSDKKDQTGAIKLAIVKALLEQTAEHSPDGRAIYRTAEEQFKRLDEFWDEWKHCFNDSGKAVRHYGILS